MLKALPSALEALMPWRGEEIFSSWTYWYALLVVYLRLPLPDRIRLKCTEDSQNVEAGSTRKLLVLLILLMLLLMLIPHAA